MISLEQGPGDLTLDSGQSSTIARWHSTRFGSRVLRILSGRALRRGSRCAGRLDSARPGADRASGSSAYVDELLSRTGRRAWPGTFATRRQGRAQPLGPEPTPCGWWSNLARRARVRCQGPVRTRPTSSSAIRGSGPSQPGGRRARRARSDGALRPRQIRRRSRLP